MTQSGSHVCNMSERHRVKGALRRFLGGDFDHDFIRT